MALKYAPTVIIACYMLHSFLIDNRSIGEQNIMNPYPNNCDKEQLNPIEYENEKQYESIGKNHRNILY